MFPTTQSILVTEHTEQNKVVASQQVLTSKKGWLSNGCMLCSNASRLNQLSCLARQDWVTASPCVPPCTFHTTHRLPETLFLPAQSPGTQGGVRFMVVVVSVPGYCSECRVSHKNTANLCGRQLEAKAGCLCLLSNIYHGLQQVPCH